VMDTGVRVCLSETVQPLSSPSLGAIFSIATHYSVLVSDTTRAKEN